MKHVVMLFFVALLFSACNTEAPVDPAASQSPAPEFMISTDQTSSGADVAVTDERIDQRVRLEVQQLTRLLSLTPRQQAAIADILKKKYETQAQLMRRLQNDPPALRRALAQLETRTNQAIMNLLTREQLLRWRRFKGL